MEKRCSKYRLHWLSWQPTPYNDFLFQTLSADPEIDLTIHFRERGLASHPWQSNLAQGYRSRYYHRVFGVDWHVLSVVFRERDAFFVVAGWDHPTAILLINLLSLIGRRFAVWTDTPNVERKRNLFFILLRSYWLKWVFRRVTKVMGTGRPGIEALKEMGVSESKLVIFPFYLDLSAFVREIVPFSTDVRRPVRFISSGRIENSLKGHDVALRALEMASRGSERSFEYYIVGTGPDAMELRNLCSRLGIEKYVKFPGWIEPDELRSLYLAADVLIHPSPVHDPFPNAVLEGMAAGLPVLGSDVSGSVKDRIEHGINGFIHQAGDVQALAEQIRFFLRNPENIAEMGRRAREKAERWPIEQGVRTVRGLLHN